MKEKILVGLKEILNVFEKSEVWCFACSLLMVYEGENLSETSKNENVVVKLIDFDHLFEKDKYPDLDDGCILGMKTLCDTFSTILSEKN